MFGREPLLPADLVTGARSDKGLSDPSTYVSELSEQMEFIHDIARENNQCHNQIFKEALSSKPEYLSKEPELDVNGNIVTKKSGNDSGKGQDVLTQKKFEMNVIENILGELLPPGCLSPIPLTPPRRRKSEGVEKDIS